MTTFREFKFLDIFNFNAPTMDSFIFAYSIGRYVNHCTEHQQYNGVVEHPNGEIMAYVVGKSDGNNEQDLHGHITSLTVSPKYRRIGIATKLLKFVEDGSKRACAVFLTFRGIAAGDSSVLKHENDPIVQLLSQIDQKSEKNTMINNLGTKLFQSVTDKAGDLGDRFEVEFSYLSRNVTVDLNAIVTEAISLSGYIKVTIVILCILLVLVIIRLLAFGLRCLLFKAKEWIKDLRPPPQVILMMPTEDGDFKRASTVYTDQQTKRILEKLKLDPISEMESGKRNKPDRPLLQD